MNESENDEDFVRALALHEENVYKKIDPILQLYKEDKITKKELIERLAEAFYSLELKRRIDLWTV